MFRELRFPLRSLSWGHIITSAERTDVIRITNNQKIYNEPTSFKILKRICEQDFSAL